MAKPNRVNAGLVRHWLTEQGYDWHEFNNGAHFRILGPVAVVDLWPGKMTAHIVMTEGTDHNRYFSLSYNFRQEELNNLLEGRLPHERTIR